MKQATSPVISAVVPVYNESAGLRQFHGTLQAALRSTGLAYEIVYVDDGSLDDSIRIIRDLRHADRRIRLVKLTRNFGREIATTAGLHAARGEAIITLDADGQHPVSALPEFIAAWRNGANVVVGVRRNRQASSLKLLGSRLFYGAFNRFTGMKLNPNATDFRLIDRSVQAEFNRMSERNRITRGLIDWLGHEQAQVRYDEKPRLAGQATQSTRKLFKLAIDSAISLSSSPLYLVAYIGAVVLPVATVLGLGMLVNFALRDPLGLHATGGAYMMVFILFLIGVLLVSQGIIGLYLSHIHTETQGRPLYILDNEQSEDD